MTQAAIAFQIRRLNYLRTLAPVIEAAVAHPNVSPILVYVNMRDEAPDPISSLPEPLRGLATQGRMQIVEAGDEVEAHVWYEKADATVSIHGYTAGQPETRSVKPDTLWCAVYDAGHSAMKGHGFDEADLMFWPSEYFLNYAVERGLGTLDDLRPRSRFSGYVRADQFQWTNAEKSKVLWGIDADKPVVLLIPDTAGLRRRGTLALSDWYMDIWLCESPLRRLWNAIVKNRSLELLKSALFDRAIGYDKVLKQVRKFCDRNGAQLVIASRRRKDFWKGQNFTKSEQRVADILLPDAEGYPQPLLMALEMADLVVTSCYSESIMDATSAGTPYVTVGTPEKSFSDTYRTELFNGNYVETYRKERGHRPGVTWWIDYAVFNQEFGTRSLADFALSPERLEAYAATYLGPLDRSSGKRVIEEILATLRTEGTNS